MMEDRKPYTIIYKAKKDPDQEPNSLVNCTARLSSLDELAFYEDISSLTYAFSREEIRQARDRARTSLAIKRKEIDIRAARMRLRCLQQDLNRYLAAHCVADQEIGGPKDA